MPDEWLERFRQRDRRALARFISRTANGQSMRDTLAALGPVAHPARVAAITGSAGVGKSTLIGKLIDVIRGDGLSVAVLACDPQSPISGGALLGDRFRLPSQPDDGIYIRSLATAGGHGAVADHLNDMIGLLERFGFDVIIIETVGAGQGDTSVSALVDVVVLLLQPETGDDLQWEKAGLLEVADIIAINKADLPGAAILETQVRAILDLSAPPSAPVILVSSKTVENIGNLWRAMLGLPLRRHGAIGTEKDLIQLAQARLAEQFHDARRAGQTGVANLVASWQQQQIDTDAAVEQLIRLLADCT